MDVVVTGSRKDEDPFLSDRSVAVVSRKQLGERQPRTTPEALWDTPGVFVQQTNHAGGSPIVRGLVGPQVLLMLDGVRLNNSVYRTGPLQYLNLVDPLSIARIEVLRGPGSVLYGSDAMGGVIQLFAHEPRDSRQVAEPEAHGTSQVRYGSAGNTMGAHGRAELDVQGFGALAGGTLQSHDDLRGGKDVGVQPYSGYSDYSALGSLAYRFGDGPLEDWHAKATYVFSRLDGAGRADRLVDSQRLGIYDNEMHLVYGRMHHEVPSIATTFDLTPSYQHFFERSDNIALASDLRTRQSTVRDEVEVDTFGLDAQLETTLVPDRLVLRYGGLFYQDWVDAQRLEGEPGEEWIRRPDQSYPSGSTYNHFGGFAMLEGAPVATDSGHRLQLRGGYRLHGMAGDAPARETLPAADFSHLGHVFMGAAQYAYRKLGTVALSYAQGFRAPNLQEAVMLGDSGTFFHVPSTELGPERSHTFELLGRTQVWRLEWHWSGYVSLLGDLLKRVPTSFEGETEIEGKQVVHHANSEEGAVLWGTEAGLGIDLGLGLSLLGQVSYAWGEESLADGTTQPLSRIPPMFGLTSLRYDRELRKRWKGFVETYARWALEQYRLSPRDEGDVRIPAGGTPGWWTWNVRAGLSGDGHYRLVLAVENLLDATYKLHGSGVYGAGTNAMISYEASF